MEAVVDALREKAARAAFDAFYAEGTPYSEVERAMFLQVADAVIRVVGEYVLIAAAGEGE